MITANKELAQNPNMFNSIEMCLAGMAVPKLESTSNIPKLPMSPTNKFIQNEQSTMRMSVATDGRDSLVGPSRQGNKKSKVDKESQFRNSNRGQDFKFVTGYSLKSNSVNKPTKEYKHFMNRKNKY